MPLVASVDYVARRIYLTADATIGTFDTLDVYREVRALRVSNEAHRKFRPMIVAAGNIQKTSTTFTQPYAQLLYGCRMIPANFEGVIKLVRDTFTDDGASGADCFDRSAVTENVDIDVQVQAVEVRTVSTSGGSGLTSGQAQSLALIEKILRNRLHTDPTTGQMTVFDDDSITPLLSGPIFEDVAGAQPYRNMGIDRRGRLT